MKILKISLAFMLISISLLFNCTASKYEKRVVVYTYDFTKYTNKGFLFTPETYPYDYESIGVIEIEIYPETEKVPKKNITNQYGTEDYDKSTKWIYYSISPEEVLDSLYNLSISMGANAFVRLQIEDFQVSYGTVYSYGKRASGFAIKRKGVPK